MGAQRTAERTHVIGIAVIVAAADRRAIAREVETSESPASHWKDGDPRAGYGGEQVERRTGHVKADHQRWLAS
jgi:hypothetical protein